MVSRDGLVVRRCRLDDRGRNEVRAENVALQCIEPLIVGNVLRELERATHSRYQRRLRRDFKMPSYRERVAEVPYRPSTHRTVGVDAVARAQDVVGNNSNGPQVLARFLVDGTR